ncbi:hypothetical protein DYB32_003823 [Aphanomyces invadans]|uniref:Sorting nexin/Vps5-like C-terminal domain-containing protein n=1 Tax=Aphanomyces invadans TaxID=157072 RepID=A0A418AZJ6_9STRA|nr:hypothetical protein DYB32_003823 [Aphanomyces invadans]
MELKSSADATDFVLNFVGGPIKFRAEEGVLFAKLFHIANSPSFPGLVAGRELLAIAPAVAAYVPKASTMSGLWSSMKDSLFVSSVQQVVEIKTDEDYTKIGEHIDEYRSRIEELVRCSDVVYTAGRSQGYEMSRCGTFLSALAVHEREDQPMSHLVGNAGEVFEAVSNLYQDELDKLLALYVSNIRYLAGKVGAVKTVLTNREQAIQEVHQASATMHRNKERFAAARASSGAAASAMIAEQKMVSVGAHRMNLAKEQVDFIATSLKVEAKRLYLGKTEELKQSLLALATTNSEYHARVCPSPSLIQADALTGARGMEWVGRVDGCDK